jgi:hypothetical protein
MPESTPETFQKFMRLTKIDAVQRTVTGVLAAECIDLSGEILDYETAKPAFKAWSDELEKSTDGKSKGNVREMHANSAVGKLIDIWFDDATKSIHGTAKIVDDAAWKKCEAGVYTGFSLGGKYEKRWQDPANTNAKRYTPSIVEVSVVDLPCIPVAKFEFVKADGAVELRKFKALEEADAALKQVWLADDGTTHEKKQDALQKNLELRVKAQAEAEDADPVVKALASIDAALKAKEGGRDEAETDEATKAAAEKDAAAKAEKLDAAVKAAAEHVRKGGLYDVARCAELIESLTWFQGDLAFSAIINGDDSPLPANLKEIIASLLAFLTKMIEEVKSDLMSTDAADKAAEAKLTQTHVEAIRKASGSDDAIKGFKAPEVSVTVTADTEGVQKALGDAKDALTKAQGDLTKANEDLTKAVAERDVLKGQVEIITKERDEAVAAKTAQETKFVAELEQVGKRIEALEAQPAPAKGIKGDVTVVNKGHEDKASGAARNPVEVDVNKYAHLPPGLAREALLKDMAGNASA